MNETQTWNQLIERFAAFKAMPCLKSSGPDLNRPDPAQVLRLLRRQLLAASAHFPVRPADLTQAHVTDWLVLNGRTTQTASRSASSVWHGLWRAIIFDRDDYRCYFCGRSGEQGLQTSDGVHLALRLEIDHVIPRAHEGEDMLLSNVRTTCRTCNISRGRLLDDHFRAELRSLAQAVVTRTS